MTGNLKLLINFVWKFLGTVRFRNDHVAAILGFDLEVAFRRNTYFVRNLEGVDLLKGNSTTNLYTINLYEIDSASSICRMACATSTKSCKEKKEGNSPLPKPVPNSKQRLHLLYMDLCGPMRIANINGKRAPLFLWAEAIAIVCYTQNRSIIHHIPNTLQDVDKLETQQQHVQHQPVTIANNVPNAMFDDNTFVNPFATPSTSAAESSSSQYVDPSNMHTFYQPYPHEYQWTKDHPLEQVIREPSRPVLTRNQL
ncbi:hypothetical protein Tco_1166454 [Tanacetum coccineum]